MSTTRPALLRSLGRSAIRPSAAALQPAAIVRLAHNASRIASTMTARYGCTRPLTADTATCWRSPAPPESGGARRASHSGQSSNQCAQRAGWPSRARSVGTSTTRQPPAVGPSAPLGPRFHQQAAEEPLQSKAQQEPEPEMLKRIGKQRREWFERQRHERDAFPCNR